MKVKTIRIGISVMSLAALISCATSKTDAVYVQPYDLEAMYDENQPQPPIVTPPLANTPEMEGKAPSDAIMLSELPATAIPPGLYPVLNTLFGISSFE